MYQFISKQIKELVSKQGLDVVATTSKVLLNIQQLKLKSIQRLSLSISETLLEIPTFHGEEGFGLAESATQSTQLVQNKT